MTASPLPSDDDHTLMVALAIADGMTLDWPALGALPGESVRGLKRLERIAAGHRRLHETPQTSDPTASGHPAPIVTSDLRVAWGPLFIQYKVGQGASSDVYRAWDPRLQRQVALKVHRDHAADVRRGSLIDEGRRLARLRHPNIVTVFGAEDIEGRVGIWMEFLEGPTLADEVRRLGPLQAGEVARVGVDICRALAAVHDAQLLHRDVKAQNVMRDGSGRLVLGDFGTSLEVERSLGTNVPAAGTPLYLAPEVLAGHPPSVASDLYAVGVLLYHLLTGAFPVEGHTLADVRGGHREGRVVPLAQRRPDAPDRLRAVVASLLDAKASRRPNSATAVEVVLAPLAGAPSPGLGVREPRRVPAVATAVCLLGVALALWPLVREARRQGAVRPREGTAMSYQIASPACAGVPASNGTIACVEYVDHLRERGAAPPPPLVLYTPDNGEVRVLREASAAEYFTSAIISPDGAQVAYVAQRSDGAIEVRHLSLGSGLDALLVRAERGIRALRLTRWAASDDRIEARVWRAHGTQALLLLSPRTGAVEGAFEFPAAPQLFARSPDGRRIAFDTLQSPVGPERDIVVCVLATNECATAIRHPAHDSSPAWTPDGRLIFLSDRSGVYALWVVTVGGLRAGAPAHLRDTGRARPTPLGFDAYGTLYYELWVDLFDVFGADVSQGESHQVRLSPRAVDINKAPAWSPDGQWLAYVSQRGPFEEPTATRLVVMREADRTETEIPLEFTLNSTQLAWAPDQRHIAMRTMLGGPVVGRPGVHVVSRDERRVVQTLARAPRSAGGRPAPVGDIAWPEPDVILFSAGDGLYRFSVSTGKEEALWSPPAGESLQAMAVSADGRRIAIQLVRRSAGGAASRTILLDRSGRSLGTDLAVLAPPDAGLLVAWTADGQALIVSHRRGAAQRQQVMSLWRHPVDGAAPIPLPVEQAQVSDASAHPNGRRLAFTLGSPRIQFWMATGLDKP